MTTQWQPGSSLSALRQRSRVFAELRQFFQQRQVMEVDVPLMSSATVTDHNIESIQARGAELAGYLQSSPEYFMKRLLAAGSGDISVLAKRFAMARVAAAIILNLPCSNGTAVTGTSIS